MKTGPIIRERIQGIPSWLWRRAAAAPRLLMLDYDGTLAPFQDYPRQATPDPRALRLLYTRGCVAGWWDRPHHDYHEGMTLILFAPPGDPTGSPDRDGPD